jgi:hypothetical protein
VLWGFFFVCVVLGAWTQGLHLEPLYQPFFVMGFFWDRVSRTICSGWLWTVILLISASWVVKIIGMRPWSLALPWELKNKNIAIVWKKNHLTTQVKLEQYVNLWVCFISWKTPHLLKLFVIVKHNSEICFVL